MCDWTLETVDSVDRVGQYASLAFDDFGNPAIAYYDNNNEDLKYAKNYCIANNEGVA